MCIISKELLPHGMPNGLLSKQDAWHCGVLGCEPGNFPSLSYFSAHDVSDEVLRNDGVLPRGPSLVGTVPTDMGSCGRTRMGTLHRLSKIGILKSGTRVHN